MSQDAVSVTIQSCFALVKEVQRRVDAASSSSIDAELRQNLKLAKLALLKATKREVVLGNSSDLTDSNASLLSQTVKSDTSKRGGGAANTASSPSPTALSASFDPTSTNPYRSEVFRSAPLWSVVLCGFQWNKRKLREQSLTTMQQLLRCKEVNLDLYTTLFLSPYAGANTNATHLPGMVPAGPGAARAESTTFVHAHTGGGGGPSNTATTTASSSPRPTKAVCRVGEGVFVVLGEYLGTASEPAVQTRIFAILQALIEGKGQAYFLSKTVTRTIHAAFTVALQTSQEAIRARSQHFLQLCVVRVTKGFVVESMGNGSGASGFATSTLLADYTLDVEFDAPFTRIDVCEQPVQLASAAVAARQAGAVSGRDAADGATASSTESPGGAPSSPVPDPATNEERAGATSAASDPSNGLSLHPSCFFRSSLDESVVREAVGILDAEARLPQLLKDMISLIRSTCKLATRPLTGSPTEGNVEVRARQMALRMLERLFHELPVANCEAEHRCAAWLSLVLAACKYDLIQALVRNFGVVVPFTFFEASMHILSLIMRKCHYHMARELHTLLAVYLLPLASSPYCDFRQKHAVLAMVHELFSIPHLLVSFFINYDCSPTFDAGGQYGGLLELLVDFVVDLTFADIVALDGDEEEDWLNSDQQQLLRGECIVSLHALVRSLHRWIAEDPQDYAKSLVEGQPSQQQRGRGEQGAAGAHGRGKDEWAELYLDNWASEGESDGEREKTASTPAAAAAAAGALSRVDSETASSAEGLGASFTLGPNVSFTADPRTGATVPHWGKRRNIFYHWKHIHYLMHNKRIALDAVELINTGKWKAAKVFLEGRQYIPARLPSAEEVRAMETKDVASVPPGTSSYAELARFLSQYPGVSRDAISAIFDRINKDPASKLLLRDYLHLFHYQGVPIDVAMRDTTCKFMSWDRPMFEAQVWETIQCCFGEEYAKQNPGVISAKDADTMAGVLLFLHSNLHNEMAKNSRFNEDQFVVDANACLDIPMEPQELHAMFVRVQRRKWELDENGRTPAEAERASTVPSVSFKVITQRLIQEQARRAQELAEKHQQQQREKTTLKDSAEDAGTANSGSGLSEGGATKAFTSPVAPGEDRTSSPSPPPASSSKTAISPTSRVSMQSSYSVSQSLFMGKNDIVLLDSSTPAYGDSKDNVKLREDHHIAFTRAATAYADKLEALHRCFAGDRDSYHPQPYAVPHYAEHVRPMLLFYYPSVMACVYMGLRVLEAAPLSRQLLDIMQTLYDIAAAFVVNLGDMHDAVEATIQRCLAHEHAYQLPPPTRATFVPFLLNTI